MGSEGTRLRNGWEEERLIGGTCIHLGQQLSDGSTFPCSSLLECPQPHSTC